ncbi:hypothetical protein LWP59_24855 [Amycolatopsis acidiphila]|uniref:Uncharacterized protein n=1 Tax=Amycolatopsis acidiphila TaxID=715473 RepID=A0A558ACF4_9PSEU|nr:hypothetical protein [Amycolatopsis acidiphila]TVT21950.1 hypothetical protein FNH06_15475 [Amycolatopsis acidiphila]UIJ57374.1 hypothetical protein LWP59_24855 [Amycolatopsis acidiphila]GHG84551.1 hypothetical protein GCM10017788_56680 [Amycolatopsis acidiphila]
MPRPLIHDSRTARVIGGPAARTSNRTGARIHTGPRSESYLRALRALDGSGNLAAAKVDEFLDDLRREFTERHHALPSGIVGTCYLGAPFEVHTLALDGSIIEHYRHGEALPGRLEEARALASSPIYLAVEVYPDRFVCTRPDGSTVVLGGGA